VGNTCFIYGLRAKDSEQFFYVGSTKRDLQWRLGKHKNHVTSGLHRNPEFTRRAKEIGLDNIVIELIEEVDQDQRFQRESYWIRTLPNLINAVKNPDGEKRQVVEAEPIDWSDEDGTVQQAQARHATNLSTNIQLSKAFCWNEQRSRAAVLLASGATRDEAAAEVEVNRATIFNWLHHPDFAAEIDRLSLMIGIASRAERLRLAMRVIKSKMKDGILQSDKDSLEWLKFAQSETDGVKLDLGKLASSFAQTQTPVADRGSSTGDSEGDGVTTTDLVS
jgi:hypothetical protein